MRLDSYGIVRSRTSTLLAVLIVMIGVLSSGCDDDPPVTPTETTNSSVSFIMTGASHPNTNVDLRDTQRGVWRIARNGSMLGVLDALATFDGTTRRRVLLTITLPSMTAGAHAWVDPQGAVLSSCGIFLDIHDGSTGVETWHPVQGGTTVQQIAAVGGQITGTFSGTMRSTRSGSIVTVTNGVFSITRTSDQ